MELSNAVAVLIARMESHPEDFDVNDGELYSRTKFGDLVNGLYALTEVGSTTKNAFWYLSDADKEALADAWKKYHYTKFEKKVMEKIFDDGSAERELEEMKRQHQMHVMQQQAYQQQIARMPQPATTMNQGIYTTNHTGGLLGSAANAFSGIFK